MSGLKIPKNLFWQRFIEIIRHSKLASAQSKRAQTIWSSQQGFDFGQEFTGL